MQAVQTTANDNATPLRAAPAGAAPAGSAYSGYQIIRRNGAVVGLSRTRSRSR